jgi:hypothetical protein
VICLDEMGPASAKSFPGAGVVPVAPAGIRRPRAKLASDDGRRGRGDSFGAFVPATGATRTAPYGGRATANGVACWARGEDWRDPTIPRVSAVLDNLPAQRARDVLLGALAHPRGEVVFPPKYAASRNLIAPWGKVRRALARKGRRFETWEEVGQAVAAATQYGNAHRHPVRWGRRQRRRPARPTGIACLPIAA